MHLKKWYHVLPAARGLPCCFYFPLWCYVWYLKLSIIILVNNLQWKVNSKSLLAGRVGEWMNLRFKSCCKDCLQRSKSKYLTCMTISTVSFFLWMLKMIFEFVRVDIESNYWKGFWLDYFSSFPIIQNPISKLFQIILEKANMNTLKHQHVLPLKFSSLHCKKVLDQKFVKF